MSLELAGARAALAAVFFTRTLRLTPADATALGVPQTERCGLSETRGGTEQADGRTQARGEYTLKLPAGTLLHSLPEGLVVTIDEEPGRLFQIVWAPAASNLNLSRRYGLSETH